MSVSKFKCVVFIFFWKTEPGTMRTNILWPCSYLHVAVNRMLDLVMYQSDLWRKRKNLPNVILPVVGLSYIDAINSFYLLFFFGLMRWRSRGTAWRAASVRPAKLLRNQPDAISFHNNSHCSNIFVVESPKENNLLFAETHASIRTNPNTTTVPRRPNADSRYLRKSLCRFLLCTVLKNVITKARF